MIKANLKRLINEEEAASLMEYAILIGIVAIIAAAFSPILQGMVNNVSSQTNSRIDAAL